MTSKSNIETLEPIIDLKQHGKRGRRGREQRAIESKQSTGVIERSQAIQERGFNYIKKKKNKGNVPKQQDKRKG
jgi:hypothetical protein